MFEKERENEVNVVVLSVQLLLFLKLKRKSSVTRYGSSLFIPLSLPSFLSRIKYVFSLFECLNTVLLQQHLAGISRSAVQP